MRKIIFCPVLILIFCICGCATQQAATNTNVPTITTEITATPTTIEVSAPTDAPTSPPVPTVEIVAPTETPLPTLTPTNTPTPIPTCTPSPTPTVTPKPSKVEVPNVVGLKLNDASDILKNLGFNVGFESAYNSTKEINVILSQDLKEGTMVERGTIIWLAYCLGPEPTPTPSPKPTATPTPSATPTPRPTSTPKPSTTPYPLPPEDEIIHYEESRNGNTVTTYEDGTVVETYSESGSIVVIYPNNKKVNIYDGKIYFYEIDENGKNLYTEYIEEYQIKEEYLEKNGIPKEDFDQYKIYFMFHYNDKVNGEYRYIVNSDGSKNKWSEYKIGWETVIGRSSDHIRLYDINNNVIKIPLEDFPLYDY